MNHDSAPPGEQASRHSAAQMMTIWAVRALLWILRHLLKVFAWSSQWIYPKCLKQRGRRRQIEMLGV